MDEQFIKGRVLHIRELATKADPFTKQRLLALADRYEKGLPLSSRPRPKLPAEPPRPAKH